MKASPITIIVLLIDIYLARCLMVGKISLWLSYRPIPFHKDDSPLGFWAIWIILAVCANALLVITLTK